ncbi:MAG: hypothetical protein ACFCU7_11015 [Pleurocapsa sp.]
MSLSEIIPLEAKHTEDFIQIVSDLEERLARSLSHEALERINLADGHKWMKSRIVVKKWAVSMRH